MITADLSIAAEHKTFVLKINSVNCAGKYLWKNELFYDTKLNLEILISISPLVDLKMKQKSHKM